MDGERRYEPSVNGLVLTQNGETLRGLWNRPAALEVLSTNDHHRQQ